ncbi:AAA family ATPase, partial [bacterium]|nr:AAA family ATPase [bacterium]
DIIELQQLVRRSPVADNVIQYAVALVARTRPGGDQVPVDLKNRISWGAGPRASQYLILGARTRALLDGRPTPDIDDVRAVAVPVLRHRIITSFNAEAEGMSSVDIIKRLVAEA